MKPIRIKLSKRPRTDEECDGYEAIIPSKKRNKQSVGKENEKSHSKNHVAFNVEKPKKILAESSLPSVKIKVNNQEDINSTSEEDIDYNSDDDFDSFRETEMLMQLKKYGIKMNLKGSNGSSKTLVKSNSPEQKNNSSSEEKNIQMTLVNKFENLEESDKSEKKKSRLQVPELEKPPKDLILNYKRTPQKVQRLELYSTPEKTKNVKTPKRCSSKKRLISQDDLKQDEEVTPRKRPSVNKTPKKSSSVKKKNVSAPTTPICKIEKKLPTTPLEKAWVNLHVAVVPDGLPCREKEYNNILAFVKNKLWDGIGGCMYISGVPGTGKTATVTQVIKNLQECVKKKEVPEFKFIEINGMRLSDPRQVYVQFCQKLFDREEKISSDHAQTLLDEWFSRSNAKKKKTTVLLVDELDLICTRKQDVIYNLLDWPTRTHARLVVLAIANTMDMPERLFKGRITSRMGLTRLTFLPYTYKQLEEIVWQRLKGLNAFVQDGVQLVTRKVAAVSGDARRALDICRRAAELPGPHEEVRMTHVEQAIKEMTNSNVVKAVRNCSNVEKLFLRCLCDVSCRSNVEEVDFITVADQILSVCVLEGYPKPSVSSLLSVSNRLRCSRLIFAAQSSRTGILQRLMLNVTQDDIYYALQV